MKKEEANDILQYLIPKLEGVGIPKEFCKVDTLTGATVNKRGDVWISTKKITDKGFEDNIIGLIEAKHRKALVGDMDWRDAMAQGKEKSLSQGLGYYIVTNCVSEFRVYNSWNDEEIILDGRALSELVTSEVLRKIKTQVSKDNSYIFHKASKAIKPISESKFTLTLKNLEEIFRSATLKKGDDRIDATVSFVVLKYISEKESEDRTLDKKIKLWDKFKGIVEGKEAGDLPSEFEKMVDLIWGTESPYKQNKYKDFKKLIKFPGKLKHDHFRKIYQELDKYDFHGANFDVFGKVYERFASQTKKKEFGEFYTRRHITGMVARLLLRDVISPSDFKICDPACGTGGFLTEAYKTLIINYSENGQLNTKVIQSLKDKTLWGFDNDPTSVARTKLNMFLVGDGHTNIHENDSLASWDAEKGWDKQGFKYILTNPPMGKYDGEIKIENFDFTNESRYELLFTERIIEATEYGGDIAIVLNDGTLETPSREGFRLKLLQHCDIYAILSLTKFAFAPYTKEKTYVVFMRKKQKEELDYLLEHPNEAASKVQKFPIWHAIIDYDGLANSDKRYRTKYHDDLLEIEKIFPSAVSLAKKFTRDKSYFDANKKTFERKVNDREISEGLSGMKYGFVDMSKVSEHNFHNLLSEHYLRPYLVKSISEHDFESRLNQIIKELQRGSSEK